MMVVRSGSARRSGPPGEGDGPRSVEHGRVEGDGVLAVPDVGLADAQRRVPGPPSSSGRVTTIAAGGAPAGGGPPAAVSAGRGGWRPAAGGVTGRAATAADEPAAAAAASERPPRRRRRRGRPPPAGRPRRRVGAGSGPGRRRPPGRWRTGRPGRFASSRAMTAHSPGGTPAITSPERPRGVLGHPLEDGERVGRPERRAGRPPSCTARCPG